uniref:Uncharacterized protein n=1 Tax=Kalanchoe fedtschenkoi TaxID=63787 RepID=A0A7N0UQY5_KALFE
MAASWHVMLAVVMVLVSHATARKLLTSETHTTTSTNDVKAIAPVAGGQQIETLNAAAPAAGAAALATGDQKNFIYGGMGGAAGVGGYAVVPILGGLGGYGVLGGYHGIAGGVGGVGGLGGGAIGGGIVKGGAIGGGIIPPHFP